MANQLTLITTYGITPVAAALMLAGLTKGLSGVYESTGQSCLDPTTFSLYFLALSRLATALVVFFGIREISGRNGRRDKTAGQCFREFVDGLEVHRQDPAGPRPGPGHLRRVRRRRHGDRHRAVLRPVAQRW